MSIGAQLGRFWLRWLRYWKNVGIALDQLANAFCRGSPDETLSSRAQKARERWQRNADTPKDRRAYLWGCVLCGILDAIWEDHCLHSVERDEAK